MKVKLVFDAQFCGYAEEIIEAPNDATEAFIKAQFDKYLGLPYDDNCYYQILS